MVQTMIRFVNENVLVLIKIYNNQTIRILITYGVTILQSCP